MTEHLNSTFVIRHSSLHSYLRFMLSVICFLLMTAEYSDAQTWYRVKWVNDGDTIVLTNGQRVRYIGINTPEIAHKDQPAEPYGYAAKKYHIKLVYRKQVRLEYDRNRKDRYGRLLAYV